MSDKSKTTETSETASVISSAVPILEPGSKDARAVKAAVTHHYSGFALCLNAAGQPLAVIGKASKEAILTRLKKDGREINVA